MLTRWQAGDELAFSEFYRRHSYNLLKLAYNKTTIITIAEELVQDAFITFYDKKNEIHDNPLFYLKTILKYKVLNFWKTNESKRLLLPIESIQPSCHSSNNVMDAIFEKETGNILNQQIKLLPSQCRQVFLLSRMEKLSNKEIAEKLDISVKTVEAHITKALKHLREHVDYNWAWWATVIGFAILK